MVWLARIAGSRLGQGALDARLVPPSNPPFDPPFNPGSIPFDTNCNLVAEFSCLVGATVDSLCIEIQILRFL